MTLTDVPIREFFPVLQQILLDAFSIESFLTSLQHFTKR